MAAENAKEPLCHAIIGNIPINFHSSDLRNYFSQFIETDGFDCFHFKHRPEVRLCNNQANVSTTRTDTSSSTSKTKTQTLCCVVRLRKSRLKELQGMYHRKHWVDSKGDSQPSICLVSEIKVTGMCISRGHI